MPLRNDGVEEEVPTAGALTVDVDEEGVGRVDVLLFLIRGTRVWIFASRIFTFALISDTICTPLLLAGMPEVFGIEEYTVDERRVGTRAAVGVPRAGRREGEARDGRVDDRLRGVVGVVGVPVVGNLLVRGIPKPARCSEADLPASEEPSGESDGRGVSSDTADKGVLSISIERSESLRSAGSLVRRRSSSEF